MTSLTKTPRGEASVAACQGRLKRSTAGIRQGCRECCMKLDSRRSAGLKGVLALTFIAVAGGGAFAFARRDGGAAKPGEPPAPTGSGSTNGAPCAASEGARAADA